MCGKFQVISMQYGELPNKETYHRRSPWKVKRWNLGDTTKALICVLRTPNQVFSSTMTDSTTFAKFQEILEEFANFQKFRKMKRSSKMLEQQVNYRNMSRANHDWLKLSFRIKRHWFSDAWKVSNDLDTIWWLPNEQTYHRGSPWKVERWNLGDSRTALICLLSTPN